LSNGAGNEKGRQIQKTFFPNGQILAPHSFVLIGPTRCCCNLACSKYVTKELDWTQWISVNLQESSQIKKAKKTIKQENLHIIGSKTIIL